MSTTTKVPKTKDEILATMKTKEICFDVEKVPNPSISKGFATTTENSHAIVGYPKGVKTELHNCAERYQLVTNFEIFSELERLFKLNPKTADYQVTIHNIKNVMFAVDFVFPQYKALIKKVDEVVAGFTVRNSMNGKWSFSGFLNTYREICSNGLWGMSQALSVKNRHTEIVKVAVQTMFLEVINSLETFEMQTAKFEILAKADRKSKWEDRLEDVAKKSGVVKFHDEAKAIARMEAKNLYGGVVNDFVIYNAINHVIFDNSLNKKPQDVRAKMDERVFANLLAN
jgi:hypothetical protein